MAWSEASKIRLFEIGKEQAANDDMQLLLSTLHQSTAHLTLNQQDRILNLVERLAEESVAFGE